MAGSINSLLKEEDLSRMECDDAFTQPSQSIWKTLAKVVNQTFLHVDQMIKKNKNYLASHSCALNDL